MKKKSKIIISTFAILICLSGLCSFSVLAASNAPTTLTCPITASQVSEIKIDNGSDGKTYKISNKTVVEHIIKNLDSITFTKGKSSKEYFGYSFSTSFYDKGGKNLWGCVISSSNTIIYNNYFYTDSRSSIDFNYINSIINTYKLGDSKIVFLYILVPLCVIAIIVLIIIKKRRKPKQSIIVAIH